MEQKLIETHKPLKRKRTIQIPNISQNSQRENENLSSSQKWFQPQHHYGYLIVIFLANLQVGYCGIINSLIYHKYRPMINAIDPLNSSSSSLFEHFEVQNGRTASVEYQSPINRIMELIGHHSAPVIVLSQNSKASEQQHHSIATQKSNAIGGASDPQQHWTFIGSANEQPFQFNPQVAHQVGAPSLENVYLPSPSHSINEQPVTMLPSQMSYTPSTNLYQPMIAPIHHYGLPVDHRQQQQQQIQTQPQTEPQPIFLASYVPEVHAPPTKPPNSIQQQILWQQVTQPVDKQEVPYVKSTSAQSVQQPDPNPARQISTNLQQTNNQQHASPVNGNSSMVTSADESDSDGNEQDNQPQEQPKPPASSSESDDNDIEEPKAAVMKQVQANKDDEYDEPSSGSSTYEDKFDSDTMEEPSQSNPSAQSSSHIVSGLVKAGLNDDCLQCICRASSGCDHLVGCITRGAEEKYCGPFQLTEEYWQRAGSPGDASNEFTAFEDCANDMDCAVETISKYMQKYRKDCDGDGLHTCLDYVRLHKLKPDECDNNEKLANSFDAYWAKFQTCSDGYNRSRNAEAEEI